MKGRFTCSGCGSFGTQHIHDGSNKLSCLQCGLDHYAQLMHTEDDNGKVLEIDMSQVEPKGIHLPTAFRNEYREGYNDNDGQTI